MRTYHPIPQDAPISHREEGALSTRSWLTPRQRMQIIFALMVVVSMVLALQLMRHQLFGRPPLITASALPEKLRLRGAIVDADGHPLAIQTFRYVVVASPKVMNQRDMPAIAEKIASYLPDRSAEALLQIFLENRNSVYIELASDVPPEIGEAIMADSDLVGIGVDIYPTRFHPEKSLAAHLLGFVDVDNKGHYGVEEYFNNFLLAPTDEIEPGPDPQLDARLGAPSANAVLPQSHFIPSPARRDLILTIRRSLQFVAETRLKEAVETYEAESGVVIIMAPQTSAILAMAGYPTYNPDEYPQFPLERFVNPAISEIYEPGSVFKLITFAAALHKNAITPETQFKDTDKFIYGEQIIQNWDRKGRGNVTAQQALAQSLNVTTAKIATRAIGATDFYNTVARFGFGQNTGVELAFEAPGLVNGPNTPRWALGNLATNAFGQGISVTPLQMANAIAAIAAGGVVHRPHVVKMSINEDVVRVKKPEGASIAISPQAARTLTQMMVAAANHTKQATIPGYAIAGKTGTAEIPTLGGYKEDRTITTFVGFFPADAPQYLILVKLERPKTSAWASETAAPTFRVIAQDIITIDNLPPDAIRLQTAP
ncbi:MAG TPA: penicillin-binding protein 2 [Anaerolineae bacterium]|nr:penicillin-binding protein 2 [Anaerolineae bacterium]